MIFVETLRACNLRDATGPAVMLPHSKYGQSFFVTDGNPSMVIFLDGPHAYHAFERERAENWKGVLIGPVRISVNLASIYSPNEIGPQLGSIVVKGDRSYIVCEVKEGGWTETRPLPLGSFDAPAQGASVEDVGFNGWQAVIFEGRESKVVFSFELDQSD